MQISEEIIEKIISGGVGILPTDTIFGLAASAQKPEALSRIYELKGRPANKQMIHLIGDVSQLPVMGIHLDEGDLLQLDTVWPGPVSVILDCDDTLPDSHGGSFTIAVRLPDNQGLRKVLMKTGPIVATSVNRSGNPPLLNLGDIKLEFPDLDFYIDGMSGSLPSKLCRLEKGLPLRWIERS